MKRRAVRSHFPCLVLPPLFSDHMVIQREKPVAVWGKDAPGRRIRVIFAGFEAEARSDSRGRWKTELPPVPAEGPFRMEIHGSSSRTIHDVLAGDVWVASGQSNMQFEFMNSSGADEEIPQTDLPRIRFFNVAKGESFRRRETAHGKWVVCGPRTIGHMSAVAYYFGKTLDKSLAIPIGLIVSAWSGTTAESWAPQTNIEADPDLAGVFERWKALAPAERRILDGPWPAEFDFKETMLLPKKGTAVPVTIPLKSAGKSGNWTPASSGARISVSMGNRTAVYRFRGSADPGEWNWAQSRLAPRGKSADLRSFESVQFTARGKNKLQVEMDQPSVKDWDRFSSEPLILAPAWKRFTLPLNGFKQAGWGVARKFTPESLEAILLQPMPPVDGPRYPGGLFNAMIAPLAGYRVKGAIWYQGESNVERASEYRKLLTTLINGWRKTWRDAGMPFLIVQLPNYMKRISHPQESRWAELREAQLKVSADLPMTGLAVTIDIGEAADVHPHNKRDVGNRLAACALGLVYDPRREYSGPLLQAVRKEKNRLRLHLSHAGSGLAVKDDGVLRGFAVSGPDGKFRRARAKIMGNTVLVWSRRVANPKAVRYAWADNPDCNLINREGFLASPFRTDKS